MTEFRESRHNVAGGHEIHIAECGPADGAPVVFIHGSGPGASGRSNFRLNVDAFVAAGRRVILPDLIGYGQSSKPEGIDYTLQLFTDTLVEALTAQGVGRATLVGNSLGGGIALQMVLDRPDCADRLILMAPGCIEERERYFAMPGIAKMVSNFGGDAFTIDEQRRLITNLVYDPSAVTDQLVAERFAVARTQPKDVLMRMRTPNLQPRLGEIAQPIFVMWGEKDDFCPASGVRYFLDQCADARCMTFTRVGHWVQVERPREFDRYALAFLDA